MQNEAYNTKDLTYGLTSEEAKRRLLKFGSNEISSSPLKDFFVDFKKIMLDPMGLMLLILAGLYTLIGNKVDALIMLFAFIPVKTVDVILELRTRKALKALKSTLKITSKVFRDGKVCEILTQNIVFGDVILFEEGQTIPADGKIIEAKDLSLNEAALTGESIPIVKTLNDIFYAGTVVIQGRGLGIIEQTGSKTEFGKIVTLIKDTVTEKSPLQKKVNTFVKYILTIAIILTFLLFIIEYWYKNAGFLQSIIVAMTFGIAAMPEEFPLVFTLYLSLGAWRLIKHGVLVKSLPSVETLGSVDVICTDKTGTLTEGNFQLEEITSLDSTIPKEFIWQCALMACEEKAIDTIEIAIFEKGIEYKNRLLDWKLKWDYPFEISGKHMSHVWEKNDGETIITMKGAVEGILEHCSISESDNAKIMSLVNLFASKGKRILGLAYRTHKCVGVRELDEKKLIFLGILVFNDPIRHSAKQAIQSCQSSGITVKMLTGDYPLTAHAVADETGIIHSHDFLFTGSQLAKMTIEQRKRAYLNGNIFSRVLPDQKYEMVQFLKGSGKVVAMTGDGINDAPALKLADIGISMGLNATDIARSTAQIILLKNDFKGIVEAVFEGRKIFDNLSRSFSYLVSFHIPLVFLSFTPPILGWGEFLLPIHIVLLQLIIHPVSAYAFENISENSLKNSSSLLPKKKFFEAALSGVLLGIASLILFKFYANIISIESARSIALSCILFGNAAFVFVESWPSKNKRLFITLLSLIALTCSIFWIPEITHLLHLGKINSQYLLIAFIAGLSASMPTFIIRTLFKKNTPIIDLLSNKCFPGCEKQRV